MQGKGLSAYTLKWVAIVAMLIDHIAWGFVPNMSVAGFAMHTIGRLTAPIMCFFLAEGICYTHNLKRYLLRMAIFAALSVVPFNFFETARFRFSIESLGMIFTLFLALVNLAVWDRTKLPTAVKVLVTVVCCGLSLVGDWPVFAVLWSLGFYLCRGSFGKQAAAFCAVSVLMVLFCVWLSVAQGLVWWYMLWMLGVFLALPLLARYRGVRGGGKYAKWLFYGFYPVHLLILGVLEKL